MGKKWLIPSIMLLAMPTVMAAGTANDIWNKVLSVGNLTFLGMSDGSIVVAFTRLLIWVLLFTIFFAVLTGLGGAQGTAPMKFFNRGQAGVLAGIIATIATIFMPAQVLLATGAGWATIIALLLVGGPVVGLGYLLLTFPEKDTKGTVLLKLVLCLLLFWVLSVMKYHVSRMI